jgi:hypothetical protein
MKKAIFSFGVFLLVVAAPASAQTRAQASPKKAVVSGKVSEDGTTLIGDHHTWSVENPRTLAGREGRLVKVKCRLFPDASKIVVLSVKPADSQTQYAANPGDSAFRR